MMRQQSISELRWIAVIHKTASNAHKVIIAGTLNNSKTIRFEPTAVMTDEEIDFVIKAVEESLAQTKKTLKL